MDFTVLKKAWSTDEVIFRHFIYRTKFTASVIFFILLEGKMAKVKLLLNSSLLNIERAVISFKRDPISWEMIERQACLPWVNMCRVAWKFASIFYTYKWPKFTTACYVWKGDTYVRLHECSFFFPCIKLPEQSVCLKFMDSLMYGKETKTFMQPFAGYNNSFEYQQQSLILLTIFLQVRWVCTLINVSFCSLKLHE